MKPIDQAAAPKRSFVLTILCTAALCALTVASAVVADDAAASAADETRASSVAPSASGRAVAALESWLEAAHGDRPSLVDQPFAGVPLSREDAARVRELLWRDRVERLRQERVGEMKDGVLQIADHVMPFRYIVYGDKPADGRSLYISMHGGGSTPKRVNDQQWRNQIRLYTPSEGVYVAPRAPTDTWNMWHQSHIDGLFDRLIENMVILEDVDPDRVYLTGYSAGGDGVYQVAPRMADRFAAAAMMAGHPNETSPLGLRNLPFAVHVGEHDTGYKRNTVAAEFGKKLAALREADPAGYVHHVRLHKGKGHWMDRQDAVAIPWMAKYTRNLLPEKIVWKQDDVTHTRFYWLAVEPEHVKPRSEITARRDGQWFDVSTEDVGEVILRLNDAMCDLDKPVVVNVGGKRVHEGKVSRTIALLASTLEERGDRRGMFDAQIVIDTGVAAEGEERAVDQGERKKAKGEDETSPD